MSPVPDRPPPERTAALAAARRGALAAEALPPAQQEQLVRELVEAGWTDPQIAVHTLWSTYVVGRIRDRIGLRPNRTRTAGGEVA